MHPTDSSARADARQPAIAARGIRKHYGHVEALRGASLSVGLGEIVALVGDNGAGKSTLMKAMCGAVAPDAGEVVLGSGLRVEAGRFNAADAGVGVVYQDLALAPHLSVLENIYLGHETLMSGRPRWLGLLDRRAMAAEAQAALWRLGIALPTVEVPVSLLSGGQRQAVAIARAVKWARSVVLLDEPTASLGTRQADILVELIRNVARQGLGVLLISHDMDRLTRIADRIVVMRRGAVVAEFPGGSVTLAQIVEAMLGGTSAVGVAA
jgi:ABC-type sugar transport system ATPase subunit